MERLGKAYAKRQFELWLVATGGRAAKTYNDVGGYLLDYNPTYGGCQIERVMNEGGGVDTVTYYRMSPREFGQAVHSARATLEERTRNQH